jgi:hypothetical protein
MSDHHERDRCIEKPDPLLERLDEIETQLATVTRRLDDMHRWIVDASNTDRRD